MRCLKGPNGAPTSRYFSSCTGTWDRLQIARKARLEEQFVELLRQLVPSPEWLELLKQTVLSIWHEELGQVSDVRESVQKRITQVRARLRRLDEAFVYESSIDRKTYEEQRDKLREELTLAELELSEARIEQFDIDNALAKAISVLNNASALWIDASLEDRLRLQEVLFRRASCEMAQDFKPRLRACPSIT